MSFLRSVAVFASAAVCAHALGQITLTPVVVPGQGAPGSAGAGSFSGVQTPTLRATGRVAFTSTLINTPNPGVDNAGLWEGGPGAPGGAVGAILIQNTMHAALGGRVASGAPGLAVQNRSGGVLFAQRINPPFADDGTILYRPAAGSLVLAMQEGDAAPGIPGALIGQIGLPTIPDFALNDSGAMTILAPLTGVPSGTRAIFAGDALTQTYTLVAREGQPAPLPGAPAYSFLTPPSINGAGDVAFFSNLSAHPFASLFVKPQGGAVQSVLSLGDPAPGYPAGSTVTLLFGANSGPAMINNAGEFAVAGNASVFGVGGTVSTLWRGAPGAMQIAAKSNDPAPGAPPGANFQGGFSALINGSGAVMFSSQLSFGAFPSGFWIAPAGQAPRLLALLNDQAPDMPPGIVLTSVSNGGFAFNNRGEGLIFASLNYAVSSTPASGIFAGTPGNLRKVVASGDSLEVSPGVFRTVISVSCWTGFSPDAGRLSGINDAGQIAFSCSLVGGGTALFIAQLPNPCPGDSNGDGVVNFADLNAVLSQFGQIGPGLSGDLNGDGVVNFGDLNLVLAAFGQPCP
jgi:hypothetical protein